MAYFIADCLCREVCRSSQSSPSGIDSVTSKKRAAIVWENKATKSTEASAEHPKSYFIKKPTQTLRSFMHTFILLAEAAALFAAAPSISHYRNFIWRPGQPQRLLPLTLPARCSSTLSSVSCRKTTPHNIIKRRQNEAETSSANTKPRSLRSRSHFCGVESD